MALDIKLWCDGLGDKFITKTIIGEVGEKVE